MVEIVHSASFRPDTFRTVHCVSFQILEQYTIYLPSFELFFILPNFGAILFSYNQNPIWQLWDSALYIQQILFFLIIIGMIYRVSSQKLPCEAIQHILFMINFTFSRYNFFKETLSIIFRRKCHLFNIFLERFQTCIPRP